MKVSVLRGVTTLMLSVAVSACSVKGDVERAAVDAEGEAVVAENLIDALSQVPELNPLVRTVQMSPPATSFGRRVADLLADAGYGIQTVNGDTGEHFVRYREEAVRSELGLETSYLIAIGNVSVARSFDTQDRNDPIPLSPLYVAGTDEFSLELDDSVFNPSSADVTYALFDEAVEPQIYDFDTQSAVVEAEQTVSPTTIAAAQTPLLGAPVGRTAIVKENLYDRLESNYAAVFADYDDLRTEVLIFGNDSMRLGEANKRVVQSFVEDFNPETDLVSIIGCSHGNTEIANGNAVLAVGRANRVKEAFLFAGIDDTKVLEEGCWAGTYHEEMPERGVYMALKRRAG